MAIIMNNVGSGGTLPELTYSTYNQNVTFSGDGYIKLADGILIDGSISRPSVSQPPTVQLFTKVGNEYHPVTGVISPVSAGAGFVANDTYIGEIYIKKVGGGDFTTTAFHINYGATT